MPRKPTTFVKAARKGILVLLEQSGSPLPTLRELGEEFSVHPSTILRLLRDLETEGIVWQGPSGHFHPAGEQSNTLRGYPVCFIGREISQYYQLYQEILEGVAEVCAANDSPLILHTVQGLIQLPRNLDLPTFATPEAQKAELKKHLPMMPRRCAGFILDHLWTDQALSRASFPNGQRLQLLHGSGKHAEVISKDFRGGIELVAKYLDLRKFSKIHLVIPFEGEPLISEFIHHLRTTLGPRITEEVTYFDTDALKKLISKKHTSTCLICPEDNIALGLAAIVDEIYGSGDQLGIEVLATQGTGVITSPHSRLRYDYRRLGRAAAARILHGTKSKPARPSLINPRDDILQG